MSFICTTISKPEDQFKHHYLLALNVSKLGTIPGKTGLKTLGYCLMARLEEEGKRSVH
jgi:hypothetical protein